jgi:hypothetical protein
VTLFDLTGVQPVGADKLRCPGLWPAGGHPADDRWPERLKEHLERLKRRRSAACVCRTWPIPIIDERDDEQPAPLPERCPHCGRAIPIRAIRIVYADAGNRDAGEAEDA